MVNKEEFKKIYKEKTIGEMSKMFGVSVVTIRSYATKLGLKKGKGNNVNHNKVFNF